MLNRLIIIGNGFDLAHGLKTKYSDFLSWYWINLRDSDEFITIISENLPTNFNSLEELKERISVLKKIDGYAQLSFKNKFFDELNKIGTDQNWVDIEMFYYQKLKEFYRNEKFEKINQLNSEFERVKNKFEDYIKHIDAEMNIDEIYCDEIGEFLLPPHNKSKFHNTFLNKLPKKLRDYIVAKTLPSSVRTQSIDSKTMVLNFNYTRTLDCYKDALSQSPNVSINHIHGKAGDPDNEVVFGFGDERDDLFDEMEKQNKNEFLRFMKSSFYLQNRNYFDLQNFLEDKEYVVEIFGHSCALSDRTLLKTIFEHPNCAHIFLTYHSKEKSDNFMDLSLNMSRHFDDKKLLRSRVSNKTFCKKFPQKSVTPSRKMEQA